MKKIGAFFFLVGLLLSSGAYSNLAVNVAYLALSNQSVPGMQGDRFSSFAAPHLNAGYTVFYGQTLAGTFGVFTNLYGYLRSVATNFTGVPEGSGNFTSFDNFSDFTNTPLAYSQSIGGNLIAITGTDRNWQAGVFLLGSNMINMIANQATPIPGGQGNFTAFAYPAVLLNEGVAFWGSGNQNQEGVYAANSKGLLTKLLDTNTLVPGTIQHFLHISYLSFAKNGSNALNFAFVGVSSNNQVGLYLMENGKIKTVADQNTSIPGGVGFFTHFSDVSYDGQSGEVAFVGNGILGQTALYFYNGTKIQEAVSTDDLLPDAVGQFQHFGNCNIIGNNLVFSGEGSYQTKGIYLYELNGNLFKIISNKDKVNGTAVTDVAISHEAFSGNQVAAKIDLATGQTGIYLLTMRGVLA